MKQMTFKLMREHIIIPSKLNITFPVNGWMKFAANNFCGRENDVIIESCGSAKGVGMEWSQYDNGVNMGYW